jgi:hypothetical protein
VIFFWRPTIYGVETWRAIRSQVDPNYSAIWIAEGIDMSYQAVFDGHHLYSNTWNPPSDLTYTNQKFANWVASARQQQGADKFWVATVMPGYNDLRIRGSGYAQDREGGAYYERAWQAAIASQPNWIVINSFNEWPEGTYIEPSQSFGDQFLGLTARWSQQFKAGGGVNVAAAAVPVAPANPVPAPAVPAVEAPPPAPEPTEPTAIVEVDLLNLRGGPGTIFPVLGMLPLGSTVPISGRNAAYPDWWQVRNAADVAWVYAPMVRAAGPLAQVPAVEVATLAPPPPPEPTKLVYDPLSGELKEVR